MAQRIKQIIIFGGSFNPPQIGHARLIQAAAREPGFDELWILPSAGRRDKKISVSGEDRLAMVNLMVKDSLDATQIPIKVLRNELDRNKQTTTFETRAELEASYPDHTFHFLIGSDIVPEIKTKWVRGEELWQTMRFIVSYRPGYPIPPKEDLPLHCIQMNHTTESIDISSTHIRIHADTETIQKYTTPSVAHYIFDRKLYT